MENLHSHTVKARNQKQDDFSLTNRCRNQDKNPPPKAYSEKIIHEHNSTESLHIPTQEVACRDITIKKSESLEELKLPRRLENFESLRKAVPNFLVQNVIERMKIRFIALLNCSPFIVI